MGNLRDPTETEREMEKMQEISMRRQRQLIEELQEMEEEEEELDFFEQKRFDLIQLSQVIESLEDYVTRYELNVLELELQNQTVSNLMIYLGINKEKVEIKIQEKNKDRDYVKALVENWMLRKRDSLREFKEPLNVINSENYSLGRKIIEMNDLIKELDFEIDDIDIVTVIVRTMEALQSYTFQY